MHIVFLHVGLTDTTSSCKEVFEIVQTSTEVHYSVIYIVAMDAEWKLKCC